MVNRDVMFIRSIVCFLISLCAGVVVAGTSKQPPNIVLIVADDLGYGELGCFGQQRIQTPNLDRLAAEGMRLTNHYSGNAVCAPSRCVLMTGMHPGHATIRNNHEVKPEGQLPIRDNDVTIAELLRDAGYATGAFGKWGLGAPGSVGEPLNQGFERFFGYNCQRHAHSYYPSYLWSDRERISLDNDPPVKGHDHLVEGADPADPASYERFKGNDYAPDRINAAALAFIEENQEHPFFLYYPSIIPHLALHVPDDSLAPYLELGWDDPPFTKQEGGGYTPHFTPRAAYAAMISRLDMYVGRILQQLESLKLADRTVVIFSSDNGTTFLNREVDAEFFGSLAGLRGFKGSLYEGGIRVPTIVKWPGVVRAGSVANRVSGFEDWLPTILDICEFSSDAVPTNDGISMLPTLMGDDQAERPFLYREFPARGGQQSVRMGHWKAIRHRVSKGNTDLELYDLRRDRGEQRDLSAEHPQIVQRMSAIMEAEHSASVSN